MTNERSRERRAPAHHRRWFVTPALIVLISQAACSPAQTPQAPDGAGGRQPARASRAAAPKGLPPGKLQLPVRFESNAGQVDPDIKFIARGAGPVMYLKHGELVMNLPPAPAPRRSSWRPGLAAAGRASREGPQHLRLQLIGANPAPAVRGLDKLQGKANYFLGSDPARWKTNVDTFAAVLYDDVYPGIDLKYHGTRGSFEYDFIVAPGADPRVIKLSFKGADKVYVDRRGDLVLRTAAGEVRHRRPVVLQHGRTHGRIAGRYLVGGDGKVGFSVGRYDVSKPLIIDPVISYATYLGGEGYDRAWDVAVDSSGHAYVTGISNSGGFDEPAAKRREYASGSGSTPCVLPDDPDPEAFVVKFDTGKSGEDSFLFSAYLGGKGCDAGSGIAVDADRNIYVAGVTEVPPSSDPAPRKSTQSDFPGIEAAAPQKSCPENPAESDVEIGFGFVAKLSHDASQLLYATCLNGTFNNSALNGTYASGSLAVDAAGNAYVAGRTEGGLALTPNAYQKSRGGGEDAFVAKLDAQGTKLLYSSYLGGTERDFATALALLPGDGSSVVVTGTTYSPPTAFPVGNAFQSELQGYADAFLADIDTNASGKSSLRYFTYLGGNECHPECPPTESANAVATDHAGHAYVTGSTFSTRGTGESHFPIRNAAQSRSNQPGGEDAFVSKFDTKKPGDESLLYSTLLGGSLNDEGWGIAVDAAQNAYVTGQASSSDFPTRRPFDSGPDGACALSCAFATKVAASGKYFVYSKTLGGVVGSSIAVDRSLNVLISGTTASDTFPEPQNSYQNSFGGQTDAFLLRLSPVLPEVAGLSPAAGPTSGGTSVLIQGTGFPNAADLAESAALGEDSFMVKFGDKRAMQVIPVSPVLVQAVSPPHEPGTVQVTVTTFEGTSPTVPQGDFTYLAPEVPGAPADGGDPAGEPPDRTPVDLPRHPASEAGLSSSASSPAASSVLPPPAGPGGQAPAGNAPGQGSTTLSPPTGPAASAGPEVQVVQPSALEFGPAAQLPGVQESSVAAGSASIGEQDAEISPAPRYHMTDTTPQVAFVLFGVPALLASMGVMAATRKNLGRPREPCVALGAPGVSY